MTQCINLNEVLYKQAEDIWPNLSLKGVWFLPKSFFLDPISFELNVNVVT